MKTCSCCKKQFTLEFFQKRAASKDGFTASCKYCLRIRDAAKHKKFRDKRIQQMKEYAKTDFSKLSSKLSKLKWKEKNKEKRKSHIIVGNAIRDKKLLKEPCKVCGSTERVHAHHDDYSKPLDVRWLCAAHHRQWHAAHGIAKPLDTASIVSTMSTKS